MQKSSPKVCHDLNMIRSHILEDSFQVLYCFQHKYILLVINSLQSHNDIENENFTNFLKAL